jgi:hypothetical protein
MPEADPIILLQKGISPMDAVFALYNEGQDETAAAIVASLSRQIFEADLPKPASWLRRRIAGLLFRLLERTTRTHSRTDAHGKEVISYRNALLERTNHPYALTLLEPSRADTATFVEGGDPMNAIYMMISPEISESASLWDRILLNSVQGKDVQLRFTWETRMTHDFASRRLDRGEPVRLKAVAAGTGLSLILVLDRLLREGYDPKLITGVITDREAANAAKATRLISKLSSTRGQLMVNGEAGPGISVHIEDLSHPAPEDGHGEPFHVVTLIGILEYFLGFTCSTTEQHLNDLEPEEQTEAVDLVRKIHDMTADSGVLIANSYRVEIGARILEIFGKRLRYRNRKELQALAATAGFVPTGHFGSGNVYDVEVFSKQPAVSGER